MMQKDGVRLPDDTLQVLLEDALLKERPIHTGEDIFWIRADRFDSLKHLIKLLQTTLKIQKQRGTRLMCEDILVRIERRSHDQT